MTGSTSNRGAIFKSQSKLLDTRLKSQYKASVKLQPGKKGARIATTTSIPRYRGSYRGVYLADAKAGPRHQHDLILKRLLHWGLKLLAPESTADPPGTRQTINPNFAGSGWRASIR